MIERVEKAGTAKSDKASPEEVLGEASWGPGTERPVWKEEI